LFERDYDEAIALATPVLAAAERERDMAEAAACLKTIGRAQLALGRDEDGIATLERALALALGANANRLASPVFANLGAGCVDAFRLAPAEARLARASTSASSATSMLQGVYQTAAADAWRALGCRFECARALSQGDEAAQREALALFEALGARPMVERVRHGCARRACAACRAARDARRANIPVVPRARRWRCSNCSPRGCATRRSPCACTARRAPLTTISWRSSASSGSRRGPRR